MNGTSCTLGQPGQWRDGRRSRSTSTGSRPALDVLSLRPERVFIDPAQGSVPERVRRPKVEELIYLGDHMRTRVNLCGHDDFIIKVPNSSGHVHLKPGADGPR